MVEDHIAHNVVRVPAAGGSGRGAYFQQVSAVCAKCGMRPDLQAVDVLLLTSSVCSCAYRCGG